MYFLRVSELFQDTQEFPLGDFPKRIYFLWIQGEAAAPDLVKLNWERWFRLNPDYEIVILDGDMAIGRIGTFPIDPRNLSHQAFSDVLRAKLLSDFGGVWADASVFPITPLSEWLDKCLINNCFFAYESPGKDRPLSSWFLAARNDCLIMDEWWKAVLNFWGKPRQLLLTDKEEILIPKKPIISVSPGHGALDDSYYYFWFHYIFSYLCKTNKTFSRTWKKRCRKPASEPHRLQLYLRRNPRALPEAILAEALSAEMQKLDLRMRYPLDVLRNVMSE